MFPSFPDILMASDIFCTICRTSEQLVEPVETNCGHYFCWLVFISVCFPNSTIVLMLRPCLWLHTNSSENHQCPNCRAFVVEILPLKTNGGPERSSSQASVPPMPSCGMYNYINPRGAEALKPLVLFF